MAEPEDNHHEAENHHPAVQGPAGADLRLYGLVILVGVGGAVIGGLFVAVLQLVQRGLFPTHWSTPTHLLIMVGVGVAVMICLKVLGTPGDVELLVNNIHVNGGPEERRDLRSLIPISLLCVGSGGGMGPEAPLVQTTGAYGAWLAERFGLTRDEWRILTITGMAAGFTVLFGAPFGSAVFALEIPHRRGLQYYEALIPAIIGSLSGYAAYAILTSNGLGPRWHLGLPPTTLSVGDLGWAVACGIAGALVAAAFSYMSTFLRWLIRSIPSDIRPVLCGLALGLLAFWSKYALTFGEAQIDPLAVAKGAAGAFAIAALAKFAGTSVTLSSEWRGGFIIPLFFMGACLARAFHGLVPGAEEAVMIAAFMAAANTGVTKTPLGSTLVVTEMAGFRLLPTTLLAVIVSFALTSEVGLIHTQRERDLVGEPADDPTSGETGLENEN